MAELTWPVAGGEPPHRGLADALRRAGVLVDPGRPGQQPAGATRWLVAGATRLLAQSSPALGCLEQEATAEAVRLGHDRITLAHLILAVLVLEEQMEASGLRPESKYLPACGFVLRPYGIERELVALGIAAVRDDGPIAAPQRRRSWRSARENPPWTVAAARAADRARVVSNPGREIPAGSAHLLYAVLLDADDSGSRLLREHHMDPDAVKAGLADRLGVPVT